MSKIYLMPALGKNQQPLKVRRPDKPLLCIPQAGIQVDVGSEYYTYWLRRISDGSVIKVSKAEYDKGQKKPAKQESDK